MSAAKKVYLTPEEMLKVIPRNKKVFKRDEIDKKYEYYYTGFSPPSSLTPEEMKGIRPVFFYDVGIDEVKQCNVKTMEWTVTDAPKFAVWEETGEFAGEVEDDKSEKRDDVSGKSVADLLKEI